MLVEPLRLKLPFGGYNGGAIVEPDLPSLPVVEQVLIPPEAAKQAVAMFREHGIDCWLFVGNEWLCTNPAGDKVELETHTVQQPPTIVPEFTDAHFAAVGKIVGPSEDHDLIAQAHRADAAGARRARQCRPLAALLLRRHPAGDRQGASGRAAGRAARRRAARRNHGSRGHGQRPRDVPQGRVRRRDGQCQRCGQARRAGASHCRTTRTGSPPRSSAMFSAVEPGQKRGRPRAASWLDL